MKKLLLYILASVACLHTHGQSIGTEIGHTYYDLQTNYSSGRRIAQKADGSLSIIWAQSCDSEPNYCPVCPYPTLGSGYNHYGTSASWIHGFNGVCDEPMQEYGVLSARAQSPELLVFPSGKEMVIAHETTGLISSSRPAAGIGGMAAWSANQPIGPVTALTNAWPKAVSSGGFVHMLASCDSCISANGVESPVRYYRSSDEGATWVFADMELPGMDIASFKNIGPDNYAITSNGNNVAIVVGAAAPGNQWAMWKSVDTGLTWTKTVLRSFTLTDTVTSVSNPNWQNRLNGLRQNGALYEGNDKCHAILLDQTGQVHVWSGYMLSTIDRANPQNSTPHPLYSEGIWYWNESMTAPDLLINQREDIYAPVDPVDYVGTGQIFTPIADSPYGYTGQTSMSTAAIAPNGEIYLIFSGIMEGTSNTGDSAGQSFRNLYIMKRDSSGTWQTPKNIHYEMMGYRNDFEEEVFPSIIQYLDTSYHIYLTYQKDEEPGLNTKEDYDLEEFNQIMFQGLKYTGNQVTSVSPRILANTVTISKAATIKAIPNPTSGITNLQLSFETESVISVQLTNLLNQVVKIVPARTLTGGQDNLLPLDLSAQSSGVYLCTVFVNNEPHTIRLLKE